MLKKPSFSDWGLLDCPARWLAERILRVERIDPHALIRGRANHWVIGEINKAMQDNIPVGPEDIPRLVTMFSDTLRPDERVYYTMAEQTEAEDAATWYAEGNTDAHVLDVERLTQIEIGGTEWAFKLDCAKQNPDTGELVEDEYKSGFIPAKEDIKRSPQYLIYAVAGWKVYDMPVIQAVYSLGNKFKVLVDYSTEELVRAERYIAHNARMILATFKAVEDTPEDRRAELLFTGLLGPRLNAWCGSCAVKWECPLYGSMLNTPPAHTEAAAMLPKLELVQRARTFRTNLKLMSQEAHAFEDALKAEALANPDGTVRIGQFTVQAKVTQFYVQPTQGGQRTQVRLHIKEETECVTEGTEAVNTTSGDRGSLNAGTENTSAGQPSPAVSVAESASVAPPAPSAPDTRLSSPTPSVRTRRASGGSTRTGSRSGTRGGGSRTPRTR